LQEQSGKWYKIIHIVYLEQVCEFCFFSSYEREELR
jgi:coproporphyrinogen III oxidase-like Fe-S oxidoreductase